MEYTKPSLSVATQIAALKQRGLTFKNEQDAKTKLESVSYYRLRAYTYPFQNNIDPNHPFTVAISFDEIFDLYKFDHELRQLVFKMLGIIEVAFRTQIVYQFSQKHGSHWQTDPSLCRDILRFSEQIVTLQREIGRSKEDFIIHYNNKYNSPTIPPSWMSLEVCSFGLLSKIFANLKKGKAKIKVANNFGINDISIIENWLYCFSNLRNTCAHHSRLWNRRLAAIIKLPTNPNFPFLTNKKVHPNKLYATLSCMLYILRIIRPEVNYAKQIKAVLSTCPRFNQSEMGFPKDWEKEALWQ